MPENTGLNINNQPENPADTVFSKEDTLETPANTAFDVQDASNAQLHNPLSKNLQIPEKHHNQVLFTTHIPQKMQNQTLFAMQTSQNASNQTLSTTHIPQNLQTPAKREGQAFSHSHTLNLPHKSGQNNPPCCFLNILKPKGITSFDVIYKLRKLLKIKKIGHSGTLDPLAEGVMQVAVGQATRLIDYLGSDKKYVANIKFGYISETGDAEGKITPVNTPNFTYNKLLAAIESLTGQIEQIPPVYSAIKIDGKKLCDLARANAKKNKTIENQHNLKSINSHQKQGPMPEILNQSQENLSHPSQNDNAKTLKTSNNHNLARLAMPINDPAKTLQTRFDNPSNAEFTGLCATDAAQNNSCQNEQNFSSMPNTDSNDLLNSIKIPKRNVTIYEVKILSFVTIDGNKYEINDQKLEISSSNAILKNKNIPLEAENLQITDVELEIFCSKGTYIRSFAVDLAAKLNTGAYLTALKRTMAGNFAIENSIQIEDTCLQKHAINPMMALDLPVYEVSEDEYKMVLNGVSFMQKSPQTQKSPQAQKSPQTQEASQVKEGSQTHELSQMHSSSQIINAHQKATNSNEIMLVFEHNLVSIAHLRDNKIVPKKVFK